MKSNIILSTCLSLIAASVFGGSALAQTTAMRSVNSMGNTHEIQPFNLVYLGYQGFFKDDNISSGGGFIYDFRAGKITAEKLVELAINQGRLSPEKLEDQAYINSVRFNLNNLEQN